METTTIQIVTSVWNIEKMTGYKPLTTFWSDFSMAEQFGIEAVKDTFKRAFEEWKGDYKFLTELVMVLNHKIWQWYEKTMSWHVFTMPFGRKRTIMVAKT